MVLLHIIGYLLQDLPSSRLPISILFRKNVKICLDDGLSTSDGRVETADYYRLYPLTILRRMDWSNVDMMLLLMS
jgi:hypothetical protein